MLDPILLFTHTAVSFSFLILHSHTFVLGFSQSFSQLSFSLLGRQEKSFVFSPSSSADNRLDHRVQCRGGKKGKCFGSIAMMQKNLHHCASIDRFLKLTVEGNCRHSVSLCLRCAMFNDRQIAGDGNGSKEVDYTAN